jgi:hypothetical protein
MSATSSLVMFSELLSLCEGRDASKRRLAGVAQHDRSAVAVANFGTYSAQTADSARKHPDTAGHMRKTPDRVHAGQGPSLCWSDVVPPARFEQHLHGLVPVVNCWFLPRWRYRVVAEVRVVACDDREGGATGDVVAAVA